MGWGFVPLLFLLSWHEADAEGVANGFCERCEVPRHDHKPKTTRSKTQNKLYSDPGLFYVLQYTKSGIREASLTLRFPFR